MRLRSTVRLGEGVCGRQRPLPRGDLIHVRVDARQRRKAKDGTAVSDRWRRDPLRGTADPRKGEVIEPCGVVRFFACTGLEGSVGHACHRRLLAGAGEEDGRMVGGAGVGCGWTGKKRWVWGGHAENELGGGRTEVHGGERRKDEVLDARIDPSLYLSEI